MPQRIAYGIPADHLALGFSVLILAIFLPALFAPKSFKQAMEKFFSLSNEVTRITGIIVLLIAFLFLNIRSAITLTTSRSFIALVGYIYLIQGLAMLWFPASINQFRLSILRGKASFYVLVLFGLCIGFGFGYLGLRVY